MCVLAMTIITCNITQISIRVQTNSNKSRGSLCPLPRKLTKVTPSGVKVNLAEKIIFFILLISAQLIHLYCVQGNVKDNWPILFQAFSVKFRPIHLKFFHDCVHSIIPHQHMYNYAY